VRVTRPGVVRRALRWPAELGRMRYSSRGRVGLRPCGRGPRSQAAHALCNCAERGFGLVALKLIFLFSKYIQILTNIKICVGFI
jgi:hypothetical protein